MRHPIRSNHPDPGGPQVSSFPMMWYSSLLKTSKHWSSMSLMLSIESFCFQVFTRSDGFFSKFQSGLAPVSSTDFRQNVTWLSETGWFRRSVTSLESSVSGSIAMSSYRRKWKRRESFGLRRIFSISSRSIWNRKSRNLRNMPLSEPNVEFDDDVGSFDINALMHQNQISWKPQPWSSWATGDETGTSAHPLN